MCLMTPEFVTAHRRETKVVILQLDKWSMSKVTKQDKRWKSSRNESRAQPRVTSASYTFIRTVHEKTWDTVHYASSSPPSHWDRPTAEGDLGSLNQHSWQSNLARLSPLSAWDSEKVIKPRRPWHSLMCSSMMCVWGCTGFVNCICNTQTQWSHSNAADTRGTWSLRKTWKRSISPNSPQSYL